MWRNDEYESLGRLRSGLGLPVVSWQRVWVSFTFYHEMKIQDIQLQNLTFYPLVGIAVRKWTNLTNSKSTVRHRNAALNSSLVPRRVCKPAAIPMHHFHGPYTIGQMHLPMLRIFGVPMQATRFSGSPTWLTNRTVSEERTTRIGCRRMDSRVYICSVTTQQSVAKNGARDRMLCMLAGVNFLRTHRLSPFVTSQVSRSCRLPRQRACRQPRERRRTLVQSTILNEQLLLSWLSAQ